MCRRWRCSSSRKTAGPFGRVVAADPFEDASAVVKSVHADVDLRVGPVDELAVHPDLLGLLHRRAPLSGRLEVRILASGPEVERARPGQACELGRRQGGHVMRGSGPDPDARCARKTIESMSVCDTSRCGNGATPPGSKPVARTTSSAFATRTTTLRPPRRPRARRRAGRRERARARTPRRRRRRASSRSARAHTRSPSRRRAPSAFPRRTARSARRPPPRAAPPRRARPARATLTDHVRVVHALAELRTQLRRDGRVDRRAISALPPARFRETDMLAMFTPAAPNSIPTRPMTPGTSSYEGAPCCGENSISSAKPRECTRKWRDSLPIVVPATRTPSAVTATRLV